MTEDGRFQQGGSEAAEDRHSLADESEGIFSLLGDETRLEILLELADRSDPETANNACSFSELRRAVGVDDAGRFNYHIDTLQDTFVTKDEEGYRATLAGLEVASSLYAGRYARRADEYTAATEYDCPTCEAPLQMTYESEHVALSCENDHTWFSFPVPAGATANRSPGELLDVAVTRASVNIELAREGLCPRCWGEMTVDLQPPDDHFAGIETPRPRADVACERCWLTYHVPASLVVARTPPVVGFYADHGLAPEEAVLSDRNVLESGDVTVLEEDPLVVELAISLGEETLTLELADDGELRSYERTG
ncbi:winged helix-turn-helix domain-containing protein [Salinarchaeum laminariae]|uniref:winged helix-turn-helix domain-containing protein n=1 Tax=Salinarchaeum laminariae TaxID=869888 RepID=UPI0020C0A4DD|nr:winged helix-turn-helix domain-containing protein [Salinarchaeum laminariae]